MGKVVASVDSSSVVVSEDESLEDTVVVLVVDVELSVLDVVVVMFVVVS